MKRNRYFFRCMLLDSFSSLQSFPANFTEPWCPKRHI